MWGNRITGFFLTVSKKGPATSTALNSVFSGLESGTPDVVAPQEGQKAAPSGTSLPHLEQNQKKLSRKKNTRDSNKFS